MSRRVLRRKGGQRRGGRGGGAGARKILDFTTGTFTRSTSGYYYPTPSTQVSVGDNVLRTQDDPVADGALALFEGARSNLVARSAQFDNAAWTKVGGVTVDAGAGTGPDGAASADRINFTAVATDEIQQAWNGALAADNRRAVHSVWLRTESGTKNLILRIINKDLTTTDNSISVDTTWREYVVTGIIGAGAVAPVFVVRNDAGGAAGAVLAWGAVAEDVGTSSTDLFTDSYIETAGGVATRGLDSLVWPVGLDPIGKLNAGAYYIDVAPYWASSLVSTRILLSRDANNEVRFQSSAGCVVRVVSGGVTMVTSNVLTFSAHQKLRITVNPILGSITVSGATTGDGTVTGTPWAWATAASVRCGGRNAGSAEFYGRISEPYAA